jgi:hypothetical protein
MSHGRLLSPDHCLMIDVVRIGQIAAMSHFVAVVRRWLDAQLADRTRVLIHDVALPRPVQATLIVNRPFRRKTHALALVVECGRLTARMLYTGLLQRHARVAGLG